MSQMASLAGALAGASPSVRFEVGTVVAPVGSSMTSVLVLLGETEREVTVPYEHIGVAVRALEGFQDVVQVCLYGNQAWIQTIIAPTQWQQNGDTIVFSDPPYSDMGSSWQVRAGIVQISMAIQRSSNISADANGNVVGDPIVAQLAPALRTADESWVTAVGMNGSSTAKFRMSTLTGEIKLVAGTASQVLIGTAGATVLGFSYEL